MVVVVNWSTKDATKLTNALQPVDGVKPIPIHKKCRVCKMRKLLSEFDIDDKKRDKHATTCKSCIEQRKKEAEKEACGHGTDCINKLLAGIFYQLDCLLAMVDSSS